MNKKTNTRSWLRFACLLTFFWIIRYPCELAERIGTIASKCLGTVALKTSSARWRARNGAAS